MKRVLAGGFFALVGSYWTIEIIKFVFEKRLLANLMLSLSNLMEPVVFIPLILLIVSISTTLLGLVLLFTGISPNKE